MALLESESCDDGDPCTSGTVCTNGICGGGTGVVCEDASPCSVGRCLPGHGCSQVQLVDVVCDDGDPCAGHDRCGEGGCAGIVLPDCGLPFCGDGACNAGETCATCPRDCSPMGFGACGAPCDPLAPLGSNGQGGGGGSACAGACVPSDNGGVSVEVRSYGNGLCGVGCSRDRDCGEGFSCLRVFGAERPGLCRPRCDMGNPAGCGELTCAPSPEDSTVGACRESTVCDPDDADACGEGFRCTPVGTITVCLGSCAVNDPIACGGLGCTPLVDQRFREGLALPARAGRLRPDR